MNRREVITALAALAAVPARVVAQQQTTKVARIGYLATDFANGSRFVDAFRQGLREQGYVEGRSVVIEFRDAHGDLNRFPALAAELVALKVDVIFAPGTQHVQAAREATKTIPIVFADVSDPVSRGFVSSLARPGGNITGLSNLNPELIGKWLELLKQIVPGLRQVAFLWQPGYLPQRAREAIVNEAEAAARALGLRVHFVEAAAREDFERAFAEIAKLRVGALIVWGNVTFIRERRSLVDLAARNRLPGAYPFAPFVEAGGLMSYAPDVIDSFRRAAVYVDRILKGADPADLPVEQPTKFELVVNLTAAKALGLTLPPSLLQRADRVVE